MSFDCARYRNNTERLFDALKNILKRYGIVLVLVTGSLLIFSSRFTIGVNVTQSLPHTLYLIDKADHKIKTGDYVAFSWQTHPDSCRLTLSSDDCMPDPIATNTTVIKEVRGVPNDRIRIIDHTVWINEKAISLIKTHAKDGSRLLPVTDGTIDQGQLYVHADHPDSLDSRYRIPGLINKSQIKGRAYPLF